jgi:murein tripeptide amidase MpaA
MVEGFINFLCDNSAESESLRNSIVFKVVPMVNPDGVVIGNYRTSLSGKDLNR